MGKMIRPAHFVGLLLAVVPLCRYAEIEIKDRRAAAGNTSDQWTARSQLLARSKVFVSDGADVGSLDLSKSPRDPRPFDPEAPVTCHYVPKEITGTTTKFDCRLDDGSVVKVKYGGLPEPKAEVAATRLLAALGFAADHVSFVHRLRCEGCNISPYRVRRLAEFYYAGSLVDWLSRPMSQDFEWVSVERKFEAPTINLVSMNGWGFADLEKVDAAKGGATRAEVDALRLIAVFQAHWDKKPPNQRMVCMDDPDGESDNAQCAKPLLMLQDVGATFGPTKMKIDKWRETPIWGDAASCKIDFSMMPYHGAGFPSLSISEGGRALLAERLRRLSERQITDLFAAARFPNPPEWVKVFLDKVAAIADRPACKEIGT
jgi:hypothetical protein